MNLNKLTKAELISKINGLKTNNNKDTIFSNFMTLFLLIKSFLLKITLIALIIKLFRKYSIFRRIFTIFNTILFSIFGISLIDFYEIDFLSKYFHKILDLFANFHTNILELFGKKVELPSKSERLRTIQSETNGIQTNNENSNRIIERYRKLIHKEEITPEVKPEIIQEDNNPYYKNKYIIIAGLLILSGITWYFYEDIKPVGSSILAWINAFRSRPDPDSDGSNGNIQGNYKLDLRKIKDSIKDKFYGNKKDDEDNSTESSVGLLDKTKGKGKQLDTSDKTREELERLGYVKQSHSGLQDITGQNVMGVSESNAVLKEIQAFNDLQEKGGFHSVETQQGIYSLLKERLNEISIFHPMIYQDITKNYLLKERIDKFSNFEKDIFPEIGGSNNYNEVEVATNHEQDVWSDRANTPQQLLSPQMVQETAMETIERDKPQNVVEETKQEPVTPLEILNNYWDGLKNKVLINKEKATDVNTEYLFPEVDDLFQDIEDNKIQLSDNDVINQVQNLSNETKSLKQEILNNSNISIQPDIIVDKNSTPSEMGDYFKEIIEDNKPKEQNKLSEKEKIDQKIQNDPQLLDINKNIKSNRLEYGSPSIARVGLPRPDLSPLNIPLPSSSLITDDMNEIDLNNSDENQLSNKNDSPHETIPKIKWTEEINFEIKTGNSYQRYIDIDYGEHHKDISKVLIITNDGFSNYFNPHTVNNRIQSIKWDNKPSTYEYSKDLDIYSITIIGRNNSQEIYCNPKPNFLKCFQENVGKSF